MNRDKWERTFVELLTQNLDIEPEQIRFPWRQYFNQRFTPQQAIAHLQETHKFFQISITDFSQPCK
ncbi:MAG TPA: hypothetical protein V6D19_20350 [Stenomitos sp.]